MSQTLYRAYEAILHGLVNEAQAEAAVLILSDSSAEAPHVLAQVGPLTATDWAELLLSPPRDVFVHPLSSSGETDALLAVQAAGQNGWLPAQQRLIRGAAYSIEVLSRAGDAEIDWGNIIASQRILPVTEEELSRIVLDIHDGPVQKMFAALNHVTHLQHIVRRISIEQITPAHCDEVQAGLKKTSRLLEASLTEIRTFLGAFRPPEFNTRSLLDVLEGLIIQHEELTDTTVEFEADGDLPAVSPPIKIALYRILQEALSNSVRHAGVDEHFVRLWLEDGYICLEIVDFGRGFTPPDLTGPQATERSEHIGLRGMRDRVQLVGGHFDLYSHPQEGTRITVKVPRHG